MPTPPLPLSHMYPASGHPTIVVVSSVFCQWPPTTWSLSPLYHDNAHPTTFIVSYVFCQWQPTIVVVSSVCCQWSPTTSTVIWQCSPTNVTVSCHCSPHHFHSLFASDVAHIKTNQIKHNQTRNKQHKHTLRHNTQWYNITHIMCAWLLGRTTDLRISEFSNTSLMFRLLLERSLISTYCTELS